MKLIRLSTLGWLLLLTLAPITRSQAVPVQADGQGFGMLVPLDPDSGSRTKGSYLFADDKNAKEQAANASLGGQNVTNSNNVQIGFDFLRPYWSFRDFTLAVPSGRAGSFPLLGDIGNVDDHFGMVPNLKYKYQFAETEFGIKAAGTIMDLSGRLQRQVADTAGGIGTLSATSTLKIAAANIPEFTLRFYYGDLFPRGSLFHCSTFDDMAVDLGVGTRYSSIAQEYSGKLTNTTAAGVNSSTRESTQNFRGVGLTTTIELSQPVQQNWVIFTNLRSSILVGENVRESTQTLNLAGIANTNTISQTKTEFIPVLDLEMGTEWGYELANRLRNNEVPPLFTVRVAAVGQFWGGVGPLSAGSPQAFRTSNLFLVGAHVMVGFHR